VQLEQQAQEAQRRAAESEQKVVELNRVLDETAASFEELKQEHAATLDDLAWYKRWAFGRRRERFREGEGQGHLFDLAPPADSDSEDSMTPDQEAEVEIKGHRRRKKRKIDWDKLRQIRHEHDLSDEEKVCPCGRTMEATAELLRPLYDLQREPVLQSELMWTDDIPITVLGGPKGSFKGHFWTYIGDREHPYSVYDFTTSHSRDGPARFLQDYSGYLHAGRMTGRSMRAASFASVKRIRYWTKSKRT
jgi:hypothetical protein